MASMTKTPFYMILTASALTQATAGNIRTRRLASSSEIGWGILAVAGSAVMGLILICLIVKLAKCIGGWCENIDEHGLFGTANLG